MSRALKFRAWHKTKKQMMFFELSELNDSMITKVEDGWYLEDCELMQYTGLHDAKGNEIYEGDILLVGKDKEHRFYPPVFVKWRNDRWVFASPQGGCWSFQDSYFGLDMMIYTENIVHVQGNIYEHPHLLV